MKNRAKIEAQAEKYVKRKKFQEAIREYQKLLSGDEQDIQIRNIIGDLYVKSGQNVKAVEELQKLVSLYEEKGLYSKSIAILKRIKRLDPENFESLKKLAQLYQNQGYNSEAMAVYATLAENFKKKNKMEDAIQMFELLLNLSPKDIDTRVSMAELLCKVKQTHKAVEEYNRVAELQIQKGKIKEAQEILNKAKELKENDPQTLALLIDILKRENKKKEALSVVNEILKDDKDNIKALHILADLHGDDGNYDEAEGVYAKILEIQPKEIEARVKLGKILIQKEDLDKAYETYEPLVDMLTRKQKEDKAIGLLGLILSTKKSHLPTLEKLGILYRSSGKKDHLEIVNRVLMEAYRKNNLREKMLSTLEEMVSLFPENEEYYHEYRKLKEELGISDEEGKTEEASYPLDETKEVVEKTLAKADLYLSQGLVRNATRILENLSARYPEEHRIQKKLDKVKKLTLDVKEDDILDRIEKVKEEETQILDKIPDTMPRREVPVYQEKEEEAEISQEEKITAADIFAETDIIPDITADGKSVRFFELSEEIKDELEAIKSVFDHQMRGDTAIIEKPLADIVAEFRSDLERKIEKDDYEGHYNLSIAFLEQGLLDEAIEESKIAAKSKKLTVDAYGIIAFCLRQQRKLQEAQKWLEKTQEIVEEGSSQYFAVKYELASLYEDLAEKEKALEAFREIRDWDSSYRSVKKKIKSLEKLA